MIIDLLWFLFNSERRLQYKDVNLQLMHNMTLCSWYSTAVWPKFQNFEIKIM